MSSATVSVRSKSVTHARTHSATSRRANSTSADGKSHAAVSKRSSRSIDRDNGEKRNAQHQACCNGNFGNSSNNRHSQSANNVSHVTHASGLDSCNGARATHQSSSKANKKALPKV